MNFELFNSDSWKKWSIKCSWGLGEVRFISPQWVQEKAMLGHQENLIFPAQKATDWLIIYSLCQKNFCRTVWRTNCLPCFCINLWNDYNSWFFSFFKNIHSWNFKFDSRVVNSNPVIKSSLILQSFFKSLKFCQKPHSRIIFNYFSTII